MKMKNYVWKGRVLLVSMMAMLSVVLINCEEKDEAPAPIASFQFDVDDDNFLKVTFSNFSQNAATYSWAFGDGNTSTDENPVHTYAAAGTYEVVLTAIGSDGQEATRSENVTIADPNTALTSLAGTESKVWILQRQGTALGIGPAAADTQWWSFGGVTPLGDRPCILDDEYTFERTGKFILNSNNTIFTDGEGNGGWNSDNADKCGNEDEINFLSSGGVDMSAYKNGGNYSYTFANNTLTLSGDGVYIGLANKTNAGDIGTSRAPQTQMTYQVVKLVDNADVDTLVLALQVNNESIYWTYFLVHYDNEALKPAIPSAEPRAGFSFLASNLSVQFTNTSANATSYSWDFGDGATSTEENPLHTYAADGTYNVKLVASDGSKSNEIIQQVGVSAAVFSASVLSSESGKSWTLAPVAGAFRVGPGAGSGEWFASSEADVTTRACQYDDEFIFKTESGFEVKLNGETWGEGYMAVNPAGCVKEDSLSGAFVEFASASNYTFSVVEATETSRAKVTVTGLGAYLGFSKGFNGGEYQGTESELKAAVTYEVVSYFKDATTERVEVSVDISGDQSGGAWWTMILQAKN